MGMDRQTDAINAAWQQSHAHLPLSQGLAPPLHLSPLPLVFSAFEPTSLVLSHIHTHTRTLTHTHTPIPYFPTQAGVTRTSKRGGGGGSGSSAQWVATIQAAGGLVRTNIPMRNTILRIALTNKKQVLIPDVQKLVNQLGNVNTDLFASRLLRPPSSVLLLPLRASGVGAHALPTCVVVCDVVVSSSAV